MRLVDAASGCELKRSSGYSATIASMAGEKPRIASALRALRRRNNVGKFLHLFSKRSACSIEKYFPGIHDPPRIQSCFHGAHHREGFGADFLFEEFAFADADAVFAAAGAAEGEGTGDDFAV